MKLSADLYWSLQSSRLQIRAKATRASIFMDRCATYLKKYALYSRVSALSTIGSMSIFDTTLAFIYLSQLKFRNGALRANLEIILVRIQL